MRYAKGLRYAIALTAATALGAMGCSDNNNSNPDSGVAGRSGSGGSGGAAGRAGSGGAGGSGGVLGTGGAGIGGAGATGGVIGGGGAGTGGAAGGNGGRVGTGGSGGHGGRGAAGAPGSGGQAGGIAGHGGAGGHAGAAGGAAGATAMLSDGQIVAVLLEANAGEVHTADVADARATDGDVRTFSMQIRSDHSAAAMRLNALVQSQGFTVADSPQRQMVAASANDVVDTLWMSSMNQFDRTFAQAQVMLHTSTLNLIDDVLLPQVDNPALRSEVQVERAAVAMHLSEAQALSAALATSSGAGGAGGAAGAGGAGGAGGR